MSDSGLSVGKSGNVSARHGDAMLITPTGIAYDQLRADDIVVIGLDGYVAARQRRPSSEWQFHLGIYRARAEVGGIVHSHSRYATALACAGLAIPAFHYMVAVAGGSEIPLAPYALFGSEELSRNVVATLAGLRAVLLEHHGQVATGPDAMSALDLAHEVEELAAQYVVTRTLGSQRVLPADEMARVIDKFRSYGRQDGEEHGEREEG
jgi:L-fuculose-phosphate aldolase